MICNTNSALTAYSSSDRLHVRSRYSFIFFRQKPSEKYFKRLNGEKYPQTARQRVIAQLGGPLLPLLLYTIRYKLKSSGASLTPRGDNKTNLQIC